VQTAIHNKENYPNFDYYTYLISFHLDSSEFSEMVEVNTEAYYNHLQNSIDKEKISELQKPMEEIINLD
jgi:hypothetical protein